MKKVADIREEYTLGELLEQDLAPTPTEQFARWFEDALNHQVVEPNAMSLSTVSETGRPRSRIVLLKEFNAGGFVFYTNYQSHKGKDLEANPHAALLFFWPELQRQVRIEGSVTRLDGMASDAYFRSRPMGSQLGAWASPQSRTVPDRAFLDQRLEDVTREYAENKPIDRPEHWGGFVLAPIRVEFWQGRANRMHDRLLFELTDQVSSGVPDQQSVGQKWTVRRLAP